MSHLRKPSCFVASLVMLFGTLIVGCPSDFLANLTEERSGSVTVIVINNTEYRASFTLGGYDDLIRNPPAAADLSQQRVEALTSTAAITLDCVRNIAIGTDDLVQRVLDTDGDEVSNFDDDAFSANINFSSAPIDSTQAALPTVGTAAGIEVLLGVDFACGDQLIFTLEQDATATGGFSIDFNVLQTDADE